MYVYTTMQMQNKVENDTGEIRMGNLDSEAGRMMECEGKSRL